MSKLAICKIWLAVSANYLIAHFCPANSCTNLFEFKANREKTFNNYLTQLEGLFASASLTNTKRDIKCRRKWKEEPLAKAKIIWIKKL